MTLTKTLSAEPAVLDVIAKMQFTETASGIVGALPGGQLERSLYVAVNKFLEAMGGKWNKKLGGHLFALDPREKVAGLVGDGKLTVKRDGYFPTPNAVAEQMAKYAELQPHRIALEPSAGTGHIADVIRPMVARVDVIELDPQRRAALIARGYNVVADDFLAFAGQYDRILMNPPFEEEQDTIHVRHAFNCLNRNGILVAIMSAGVKFRTTKRAIGFREHILEGGEVIDLEPGAFHTSGTDVNAVMVVIRS